MAVKAPSPFDELDDAEIDRQAREKGRDAKHAAHIFAGYLPVIDAKKIYERAGSMTIFRYAAFYGGLSKKVVREVLRLDRRVRYCPELRRMFHLGEVGWSKLRVVATLATPETDAVWARRLRECSKHILERYTSDIRNGLASPEDEPKCGADDGDRPEDEDLRDDLEGLGTDDSDDQLPDHEDLDVWFRLRRLTAERMRVRLVQLRKKRGTSMSVSDLVDRLLAGSDDDDEDPVFDAVEVLMRNLDTGVVTKRTRWGLAVVREKELATNYRITKRVEEGETVHEEGGDSFSPPDPSSRTIPAAIRRQLRHRYDDHCAFRGCHRPRAAWHHADRFARNQHHAVTRIYPLCRSHHGVSHQGLFENEDKPIGRWTLVPAHRLARRHDPRRDGIDALVRAHLLPGEKEHRPKRGPATPRRGPRSSSKRSCPR